MRTPRLRRRPSPGARALRGVLTLGGVVATGAGLHTAIAGGRSVAGEGRASAAMESELRFYGAFYAAYGAALLRLAPRAEREPEAVRAAAGALLLAGLARGGGWIATGRPHPLQQALLAIELAVPPALVAWQRTLER